MKTTNTPETTISVLKELAGAITSTSSHDSMTNLILDLTLAYTKARSGSILIIDKKGDLIVSAARGANSELIEKAGSTRKAENKALLKDAKKRGHILTGKNRKESYISCPIIMKDTFLGTINVSDKSDGTPFSENDYDLINIMASQAAIALEQTRLISELRSKASELNERNKGLIDTDRLKTEFIARMTHELRTPLNSIKGAVYYLKNKQPSNGKQAEFIDIISDESTKLVSALDGLLGFAGIERRKEPLKKRIINLRDLLEEAGSARLVKHTLANNQISINILTSDSNAAIAGDKILLLQSFIHIIDGLSGYAESGDIIEIKPCKTSSNTKVNFTLKKRTIDKSEIPAIFDERSLWYGIDIDKNKLNFYLAKKTIETHHGTVTALNSQSGFTMRVSFPENKKEYMDARTNELLDSFLSFASDSMSLNKCSIMLLDKDTGKLKIRSAIGIAEDIINSTDIGLGKKIAGRVAAENRPLLLEDIE